MPSALDTPQGAAELAESLLPPLGNRWLHTQAVAARAREVSAAVPAGERDLLVAAAWLHDIGYAPELRDTGFHPVDGARHLEALGAPGRLVRLVAHHSGAVYKFEQFHTEQAAPFPSDWVVPGVVGPFNLGTWLGKDRGNEQRRGHRGGGDAV
ncbi:HDIG domain-containing protein [Streptomyces sp. PA03-1a]|nr:HDIG domain-containing protein [Streptomyces sp. PA03-1a]